MELSHQNEKSATQGSSVNSTPNSLNSTSNTNCGNLFSIFSETLEELGSSSESEVLSCSSVGGEIKYCSESSFLTSSLDETAEMSSGHAAKICVIKNDSVGESVPTVGPKYLLEVKINRKCFRALIDSGATISAMDSSVLEQLGPDLLRRSLVTGITTQTAVGAAQKLIKEKVEVLFCVNGNQKIWTFYVIENLATSIILGSDWMEVEKAVLNAAKKTISFEGAEEAVPFANFPVGKVTENKILKMHLTNRIDIPPRSARRVTLDAGRKVSQNCVLSPNRALQFNKNILIPSTYGNLNNGEIDLWVTNMSYRNVCLAKNMVLGTVNLDDVQVCTLDNSNHCVDNNLNFTVNLGEKLTANEKDQLLSLVKKYRHVFAESECTMGKTNLVTHKIDTGVEPPIRCNPYRTSFRERREIKKKVDEFIKTDIVCPSNSPWAAPVVLIPKKDGEYRFCVDYRKINQITKKDVYPSPRVEDALDNLGNAKFFSVLDLISGFYQIEVDPQDREKTAFITPDGLYEFKRMPMGLCNSPASFQRLMDTVLKSMKWSHLLVYLDDIIVFGTTFDEMLERLGVVFQKLSEAKLTLKASKCRFGEEKLKYLGHMISQAGIEVNPEKISAVVKYTQPTNLTELRRFINLCGYYRRFVKDFAKIAAPLNQLLRKGESFVWGESQNLAFEKLKLCLVTPPVFAFPRENCETIIHTDACGYGLGATISQVQDGKERVIAYASRSLTRAECNYSTTEQECLAIVFAIGKFRPYIFGQSFKVITDHNALRWLYSIKDPNGRLARWALQLQSHDMKIEHRPGRVHSNVDALSREPVDAPSSGEQNEIWVLDLETMDIGKMQRDDLHFRSIIRKLEQCMQVSEVDELKTKTVADYCLQSNILYKANYEPNGRKWLLCVPKALKEQVLLSVHSENAGGHLGATRMYSLVSKRYYWPGQYRDTRRFVRCCRVCDLFRPKKGQQFGSMQNFKEVGKPFERVGVDFIGPFTISERGNRYCIVFVDHFSRYLEVSPVREATAAAVIEALHDKIIFRHSCPLEIVVDRGSQFLSTMMREHSRKSNYKLRFTAPYHPQTNGMTERVNQTLKNILKKYVGSDQKNWDVFLSSAVFAYNSTVHESTKFAPFYLVFNREPRVPADMEFPVLSEKSSENENEKQERFTLNQWEAKRNSKKAHDANKVRYDKNRIDKDLEVGQSVWRFQPVRKKGLTHAFLPQKTGPYKILERMSPVNYRIKLDNNNSRGKSLIVNVNDLRLIPSEFECSSCEENSTRRRIFRRKKKKPVQKRKIWSTSSCSDTEVRRGGSSAGCSVPSSSNRAGSQQNPTVDQTVDDDEEISAH